MTPPEFISHLSTHVERARLFPRTARLVVAVSGGVDSMALLHGLVGLNHDEGYGLELHVAHLDHGIRGEESSTDAAFVRSAADGLGLPHTVERVDVRSAARPGESLEDVARRCRYAFLVRVARERAGSERVATGHHADDQAETVLHRIVRGTGLRGLTGIPEARVLDAGEGGHDPVFAVRPLLPFRRADLVEFLDIQGVSHRDDRTNEERRATRNRIRHDVLPLLQEAVNPQVHEALLRLAEQARWMGTYLDEQLEPLFDALVLSRTDQEVVLNAELLSRRPRILQAEAVRRSLQALGVGEKRVGFDHVVAVLELLEDLSGTRRLDLPDKVAVFRSYNRLAFERHEATSHEELCDVVSVRLPGVTVLPRRGLQIECRVRGPGSAPIDERRHCPRPDEEWLDLDAVHPPLTLRNRRPGDRFWPLGAPGSRTVSDFLIDRKVPARDRESVALLCDALGPIYVAGHRIDERVKLTSQTRSVLQVKIAPIPPDAAGGDA